MISNATPWMYEHALYNGVATQSLRTDHSTTKNLSRTPSSESNKRTFTFSTWLKRSFLDYSTPETVHQIFSSQVDGNDYFAIFFQDDGKLYVDGYHTSQQLILVTNRLFRDTSAWYHLVVAVDTTQGTASNRIKIYVNGIQETSFSTETYPSQNYDTYINDDVKHTLGSSFDNSSQAFGGYFAETNLVDGTQLAPTSFGETKNGVWIPKKYTGSYGTNGFRLQFDQTGVGTASTSTIGADTSGNTNHYTSSGIVASDCAMPDSPENNFATGNPLIVVPSGTFSEGNLAFVRGSEATHGSCGASIALPTTGKWYWEVRAGKSANNEVIGVANILDHNPQLPSNGNEVGSRAGDYVYRTNAQKVSGNSSSSYGATYTGGDKIGVAWSSDDGTITFYKNNSSQGAAYSSITQAEGQYVPSISQAETSSKTIFNFGQDSSFAGTETAQGNTDGNGIGDFYYAPPSGYLALCSANLPEPTIGGISSTLPTDYFNTVLWTGNGGTQNITGVGFQPDWIWFKNRSNALNGAMTDSSRGLTKELANAGNGAEQTTNDGITAFGADGFSLGAGTEQYSINTNTHTYVAWNWKANGGTTSSNTDGDVTSTVQANTDAGFSIVTWTQGSGQTDVGHGLGAVPEMIIGKTRTPSSGSWGWHTFHKDLGVSKYLFLNANTAATSSSNIFNPVNSTVFGSSQFLFQASTPNVAYCFNSVEGYSKIGSYTGNGSADGTFVYTGFRPAWVMLKNTARGADWRINDSTRQHENNVGYSSAHLLLANSSSAEITNEYDIDFLSNGFKLRSGDVYENGNGEVFIYMAFAEAPFKYANAR